MKDIEKMIKIEKMIELEKMIESENIPIEQKKILKRILFNTVYGLLK